MLQPNNLINMFTVFVRTKGKDGYSQSKITTLMTREDVSMWIKKHPMIKSNTEITVTNILTNKSVTDSAISFY